MNKIIVFGSSRSFGNTKHAIDEIVGQAAIKLIDLNALKISPFDYEHHNKDDDFIPLMEKLVTYDAIIIATPVYWYSMSAQHKIFFDRFSDLLSIRKDLGRKLKGKQLFVVASFQSSYPRGFEDMFEQICKYLGMKYLGSSFICSGTEDNEFVRNNVAQIEKARTILGLA